MSLDDLNFPLFTIKGVFHPLYNLLRRWVRSHWHVWTRVIIAEQPADFHFILLARKVDSHRIVPGEPVGWIAYSIALSGQFSLIDNPMDRNRAWCHWGLLPTTLQGTHQSLIDPLESIKCHKRG